jgi:hypothetical protein
MGQWSNGVMEWWRGGGVGGDGKSGKLKLNARSNVKSGKLKFGKAGGMGKSTQ